MSKTERSTEEGNITEFVILKCDFYGMQRPDFGLFAASPPSNHALLTIVYHHKKFTFLYTGREFVIATKEDIFF
jgi:hypothetical protein